MAKNFNYDNIPVVETKAGKLKGYSFDGTYIFKGIKYADAKRFQKPTPPAPWEGVKEATSYGFVCPLLKKDTPNGELLVPHRYWPQDEDCLNLNVWTQNLTAKKPVLVWLHGGGFTAGSSIEQVAYDGANMSKYGDTVVVSVNHRLNVLGYLDVSLFGEKYANSANAGQSDLVAALQWVQDNIENFGGDKNNVTIFGQSGGGMKVSSLMQIPCAAGLFHKGVIMSGVVGNLMPTLTGDGTAIITALMKELKLTSVEELEAVPYYELANAYLKVSPEIAKLGGYIGGAPLPNDFYLGEPQINGFTEKAKNTPLLVGTVFGEFAFMPSGINKYELSDEERKEILTKKYGANTEQLISLFTKAYPEKDITDMLSLDSIFRSPTKQLINAKAEYPETPTYSYMFTFEFPYQYGKTAWHCADIPFFFHNNDKVEVCNVPGVSDKLEEQIFAALINFARTGNPNHNELPKWEPCKSGDEATMIFDRTCEVRHNFDDELLKLHMASSPKFSLFAKDEEINIQH